MKRILSAAFATILVLALCIIPASAAESYTLIPTDGNWSTVPAGGNDITVTVTDEAAVFSGEASWPCANCHYTEEQIVKVSIDDYSLVYDFTVETGDTNINFTFTDGFGSSAAYSISNTTLGSVDYDAGSGDLKAGEYKGVVKLTDLINSTANYDGKAFPQSIIGENNMLIFTDLQVYSVNGATVTIRELSLVPNDEAEIPVGDTSTEESVPADESEEVSTEESKEESAEESKEESVEASAEANSDEANSGEDSEESGISTVTVVIIAVAVVAVIAVIVIVVKKKK